MSILIAYSYLTKLEFQEQKQKSWQLLLVTWLEEHYNF